MSCPVPGATIKYVWWRIKIRLTVLCVGSSKWVWHLDEVFIPLPSVSFWQCLQNIGFDWSDAKVQLFGNFSSVVQLSLIKLKPWLFDVYCTVSIVKLMLYDSTKKCEAHELERFIYWMLFIVLIFNDWNFGGNEWLISTLLFNLLWNAITSKTISVMKEWLNWIVEQ